jgi:arylsulfatase B
MLLRPRLSARAVLALAACATTSSSTAPSSPPPPRVIWVTILDDFGHASASFNQAPPKRWEAATPRVDAQAAAGVILARHYVHSFCSPSRASFLSGRLPVHVQQSNVQPDMPNAGVPAAMTTLPEKLAALGWRSAVAGKWDVGGASAAHTPEGRGFSSSLVYFSHATDYWSQHDYSGTDTPAAEVCGDALTDLWDSGAPAALNGTAFIDELVTARLLAVITAHDFGAAPLFLLYTPHATHDPLQAPPAALARLANSTDDESLCNASIAASTTGAVFPGFSGAVPCRRVFEALVAVVDANIGRIEDALRARGVWDETLAIAFSDNGGQTDLVYGGGNNWPLRGGKGSEFEGGIRVAAWLSGGALPTAVRGSVQRGLMHGADWLATLCGLAGGTAAACVADARAAAAGLPPIDSLDLWPLLSGANASSPRFEFAASAATLVTARFKLIEGQPGSASWQGALWPNASSPAQLINPVVADCATGCLFDVNGDPGEHIDVAAAFPAELADARARLAAWRATFYTNNETARCANASLPIAHACACDAGARAGGFFVPYAFEEEA